MSNQCQAMVDKTHMKFHIWVGRQDGTVDCNVGQIPNLYHNVNIMNYRGERAEVKFTGNTPPNHDQLKFRNLMTGQVSFSWQRDIPVPPRKGIAHWLDAVSAEILINRKFQSSEIVISEASIDYKPSRISDSLREDFTVLL